MYDMYPGWGSAAAPEALALDSLEGMALGRRVARRKRPESSQPRVARVRAVQESLDRRDNGGRHHGEGLLAGRGEETWPWRGESG